MFMWYDINHVNDDKLFLGIFGFYFFKFHRHSFFFCKVIEVGKYNSIEALAAYKFNTSGNSKNENEPTELTIASNTMTGNEGKNVYV